MRGPTHVGLLPREDHARIALQRHMRALKPATWDRCSKRMEISMKMLVIELKPAG
jgi:hypothetical protein